MILYFLLLKLKKNLMTSGILRVKKQTQYLQVIFLNNQYKLNQMKLTRLKIFHVKYRS